MKRDVVERDARDLHTFARLVDDHASHRLTRVDPSEPVSDRGNELDAARRRLPCPTLPSDDPAAALGGPRESVIGAEREVRRRELAVMEHADETRARRARRRRRRRRRRGRRGRGVGLRWRRARRVGRRIGEPPRASNERRGEAAPKKRSKAHGAARSQPPCLVEPARILGPSRSSTMPRCASCASDVDGSGRSLACVAAAHARRAEVRR